MPRRKKNRAVQPEAPTRPITASPLSRIPGALLLILLATWLVYTPALNGTMLWDDDAFVTKPELRSPIGLCRIWFQIGATQQYYPLLHSAFWLEHNLWGDAVLGYHVVNVLEHSLAVVLLYLILQQLRIPGALLAAAIFALHPVMVESVAWISEQKNTLSAVFYLGATLAYLRFDESRRRSLYFLALGLFLLALMTKTVTATLPAALLVIFWWQRGSLSPKRDVLPLLPFFLVGAAGGLLTAAIERNLGGVQGAEYQLSFIARGLLAGRAVWFYLHQLLWPANLMFFYPRWSIDETQAWQWIYPIAALALTVILWLLRGRTRAPLASWLFFCGTLFPALGFLNVYPFRYSFVADHFQYLASLGIIVLVAATIAAGLARLPEFQRRAGAALCLLLVGTLAVLTWRQAGIYANSVVLYQATIDRNPECWIAHTNLGLVLSDLGNHQDAIEHLQNALRIKPDAAEIHNGLAGVLIKAGRAQEAIDETHAALAAKSDYLPAYNNLGIALMRLNRFAEAIEPLQHAVRLSPEFAMARANLGVALAHNGQTSEAIEQLSQALQSDPTQADAHNNLGLLLVGRGQLSEATKLFFAAVRLQPNRAEFHINLAAALKDAGSTQLAIEHYQAALQLEPDNLQACFNLAQALADAGRHDDALATAQRAIELATAAKDTTAIEQINKWLATLRAK